jgi:hypothetical protein
MSFFRGPATDAKTFSIFTFHSTQVSSFLAGYVLRLIRAIIIQEAALYENCIKRKSMPITGSKYMFKNPYLNNIGPFI